MPIETALAYLDESGDLGWKLDKPFQDGGSSRHFVIAIAIGANKSYTRIGKIVDTLHQYQKWTSKNEKKWATISNQAKEIFCQLTAKELASNSEIQVLVAVFHKQNAPHFLRSIEDLESDKVDPNKSKNTGRTHLIYAMLFAEILSEHLGNINNFAYCPDDLNEGHRTLEHILAYKLLIQDKRKTNLNRVEKHKAMQRGLDFADMVAGSVFEAYEKGNNDYLDTIKQFITIKEFTNEEYV